MDSKQILTVYKKLISSSSTYTKLIKHTKTSQKRKNSISIEDAFFGDSGKGRITAEFNRILQKKGKLFSLRYNGGANAGHECYIDGKQIVTHQLPMAVIENGATALMTRGVLIHPQDLLIELFEIKKQFGGKLPGKLIIDERACLSLDTHRAYETAVNTYFTNGSGSTGRGIAPGYSSFYERTPITLKDLLSSNWKDTLRKHYRLYANKTFGFGKEFQLEDIEVAQLGGRKQKVGTEREFLKKLSETRSEITQFVSPSVYSLLHMAWNETKTTFTFEGAQGAGLDPYHGIYPDVTASRPMSRFITDSTYNIIEPTDIEFRTAVMKTTYMSSVGKRTLPTTLSKKDQTWIQEAFDEKGRSTGRLRDIYEVSIPIGAYLKKAAGYDFLVATHLDASKSQIPIKVVTHYTDKKRGGEMNYFPYQDYFDNLKAHTVTFKGWNGEKVRGLTEIKKLPSEAQIFLSFLSQTIAPVLYGTTGRDFGDSLSWYNSLTL